MLKGVKTILDKNCFVIIENAFIVNTIENNEFDQIYHEHMFYYSIQSIQKALEINGLKLVDLSFSLIHGVLIIFVGAHKENKINQNKFIDKYLISEKLLLKMVI